MKRSITENAQTEFLKKIGTQIKTAWRIIIAGTAIAYDCRSRLCKRKIENVGTNSVDDVDDNDKKL